jgi:purine nucleosidase
MGGAACTYGNVTPAAEYNIWVDPEAARSVFLSGMPVEMVGWEFCQGEYALNRSEIDRIRETDTTISRFTLNSNTRAMDAYYEQTGERRLSFPDPVAMAVAIDSSIVTRSSRHLVEVETESALTRGMTVVDKLDAAADERNSRVWAEALNADSRISVTWDIHTEQWKEMLYHSLTG